MADSTDQSSNVEMKLQAAATGAAGQVGRDQVIYANCTFNSTDEEEQPSENQKRKRIVLTIEGVSLSELTPEQKVILIDAATNLSRNIKIESIEDGSINLFLEGLSTEIDRLCESITSRELITVAGLRISGTRPLTDQERQKIERFEHWPSDVNGSEIGSIPVGSEESEEDYEDYVEDFQDNLVNTNIDLLTIPDQANSDIITGDIFIDDPLLSSGRALRVNKTKLTLNLVQSFSHIGLVITDVGLSSSITIEGFNSDGISLGQSDAQILRSNTDMFLGISSNRGITSVTILTDDDSFQLDHIQYEQGQ